MSTIQERHDEQAAYERGDAGLPDVSWDDMFYKAHKDRGELLDALREIGELVDDLLLSNGEPCDQYQYGLIDAKIRCAVDLKSILDKHK